MELYIEIAMLQSSSLLSIRKRLPDFQSILQVYAVIAVMLSAWTVTAFLWKLSAWLLVLNLAEIFAVFSYGLAANLIESLIVLFVLLLLSVLFPAHILRNDFTVRGAILSIGIIGSMIAFVGLQMQFDDAIGIGLLIGPVIAILLTVLLLRYSSNLHVVANSVGWIADRLTVFLFILLPLFVISLVNVIFRNTA